MGVLENIAAERDKIRQIFGAGSTPVGPIQPVVQPGVTLGPAPVFIPMPEPVGIDINGLQQKLESIPVAGPTVFDAPPTRKKEVLADRTKENEIKDKLAPKEESYKRTNPKDRLGQILAGAAAGSRGGGSLGEVLAGAGAGAIQGKTAFNDRLQEEQLAFDEAQRRFNMLELQMAQQERAAIENLNSANNDIEYANAMSAWENVNRNKLEIRSYQEALTARAMENFRVSVDMAGLDAEQQNAKANTRYKNAVDKQQHEGPQVLSVTNDNVLMSRRNANGEQEIVNQPLGWLGHYKTQRGIAEALAPEQVAGLDADFRYSGSGIDEKKAFVYDVINSGQADKVFNNPGLFDNDYKKALSMAKKQLKSLKGGFTSDQDMQDKLMELTINILAESLSEQDVARARKSYDTNVRAGVKAFNGQ